MTGLGIWFCRQCLQLALGYYRMYQPKYLFNMAGISKFSRNIMSFFCSCRFLKKLCCLMYLNWHFDYFNALQYCKYLWGCQKLQWQVKKFCFALTLLKYFSFLQIQDRRPIICKTKSCTIEFCLTEGQINFTCYKIPFFIQKSEIWVNFITYWLEMYQLKSA